MRPKAPYASRLHARIFVVRQIDGTASAVLPAAVTSATTERAPDLGYRCTFDSDAIVRNGGLRR